MTNEKTNEKKMKTFQIRQVETVKTTAAEYPPWWCPIDTFTSWLFG